MLDRNVIDDSVGYWHDVPLSIGRLLEDALALAWRTRLRIAPVVAVLAIGTAVVDVTEPPLQLQGLPSTLPATTSALQPAIVFPTHFPTETVVWNLFSLLLVVALTKVLYAAYYDHEDLRAAKAAGFLRGALRMIGAIICYVFILLTAFLPLGLATYGLNVAVTKYGTSMLPVASLVMLLIFVLGFIALVLLIMGSMYASVGAIIRSDNLMRVVSDSIKGVLTRELTKRAFTVGCLYVAILLMLSLVAGQIAHMIHQATSAAVVSDVFSNIAITPILSAFGVVFFTDTSKRLSLMREIPVSTIAGEI